MRTILSKNTYEIYVPVSDKAKGRVRLCREKNFAKIADAAHIKFTKKTILFIWLHCHLQPEHIKEFLSSISAAVRMKVCQRRLYQSKHSLLALSLSVFCFSSIFLRLDTIVSFRHSFCRAYLIVNPVRLENNFPYFPSWWLSNYSHPSDVFSFRFSPLGNRTAGAIVAGSPNSEWNIGLRLIYFLFVVQDLFVIFYPT